MTPFHFFESIIKLESIFKLESTINQDTIYALPRFEKELSP